MSDLRKHMGVIHSRVESSDCCLPTAEMFSKVFWECAYMPTDAQDFAKHVLSAFEDAGHFTDPQVSAAGGPSSSTMTLLRKVAEGKVTINEPREPTWSKIDRAANWAPGSARRVWRGGQPVGTLVEDANYVASPGTLTVPGDTDSEVLREIRAMRESVERLVNLPAQLDSLSQRVARLEQQSAEPVGGVSSAG